MRNSVESWSHRSLVLATLNAARVKAMADPGSRRQLESLGIEPMSSTPDAFGAPIESEIPKRVAIVRKAGAHAD